MSMKSITTIPPISLKRNCLAISSAASRLFSNTVCSRLSLPTNFPVFTSITVKASVLSIIKCPPDGNHTFLSKAFLIWSSMWYLSNKSKLSSYFSTIPLSSGEVSDIYCLTLSNCLLFSINNFLKPEFKCSLMTFIEISGSSWIRTGAVPESLLVVASHSLINLSISFLSDSSLTPSAAVLTITPNPSGLIFLMILSRRLLSSSGSLREIPFVLEFGIKTRYLPGNDIWPVSLAPFSPIASLTTWTKISCSCLSRFSIFELRLEFETSATYKTPFFSSPIDTNAASIPGKIFFTLPRYIFPTRDLDLASAV